MQQQILQNFINYFTQNNLHYKQDEIPHGIKLDVSDLTNKATVIIYNTGTVSIQGSDSPLKDRLERFKGNIRYPAILACTQKYIVLARDLQNAIREELRNIPNIESEEKKVTPSKVYCLSLKKDLFQATVTQFTNGTILIQGKADDLFNDVCDRIEHIAQPSLQEVATRFISFDEDKVNNFAKACSPELIETARGKAKICLDEQLFDFLDDHDKKYVVAAFCLKLRQIPLPEYSPIVMPLSKAFEGFTKKVLISLNLADKAETKKPDWNFGKVWGSQEYRDFIRKDVYHKNFLEKLKAEIPFSRHMFMHSDEDPSAQLDTYEKAEQKINEIANIMKETYRYFASKNVL